MAKQSDRRSPVPNDFATNSESSPGISFVNRTLVLRSNSVDLRELIRSEVAPVERADVLLELRHAAYPNDRGGHARIAQDPREGHLRQLLSTVSSDLVQGAHPLDVLVHGLGSQRVTLRCARTGRHTLQLTAGEHRLRQWRHRDASDSFLLK